MTCGGKVLSASTKDNGGDGKKGTLERRRMHRVDQSHNAVRRPEQHAEVGPEHCVEGTQGISKRGGKETAWRRTTNNTAHSVERKRYGERKKCETTKDKARERGSVKRPVGMCADRT